MLPSVQMASLAILAVLPSHAFAVPDVLPRATTTPASLSPNTTASSLLPWVTVNTDGQASTVTPYLATISGSATLIDGVPDRLTATVQTYTNYGEVTTSTGAAPQPTATGTQGAGAFQICRNKNGTDAPWCLPANGTVWYPGTTYYFTWDPTYFNVSSETTNASSTTTTKTTTATVRIQGNYFNHTTGAVTSQAFESDKISAAWGYYAYTVNSNLITNSPYRDAGSVNISVQLVSLATGSQSAAILPGPYIQVARPPVYHQPRPQPPSGPALYIGLPAVAIFVVLCTVGVCMFNRQHRRIGLGNVMGRSWRGYGAGKSARDRVRPARVGRRGRKAAAVEHIEMLTREGDEDGGKVYRDAPAGDGQNGGGGRLKDAWRAPPENRSRLVLDSVALHSPTTDTPTSEHSMDFRAPPGGTREERERFLNNGEYYSIRFQDERF